MADPLPAVTAAFAWRRTAAGLTLIAADLAPFATAVFTTRDLRFAGGADDADYAAVGALLGVAAPEVIRARQVHGRTVLVVRPGDRPGAAMDADALVSTDPSVVVAVRIADCVPVLIADRKRRVVAAVHAGWRGTAAAVSHAAIDAITGLGVPASDLVAAIGPSIGPCCYQVGEAVRSAFAASGMGGEAWFRHDGPGTWKLDLWQATRDQLTRAGVPEASISIARLCTADALSVCYSFRKEGPAAGRLAAAIRLAPGGTEPSAS